MADKQIPLSIVLRTVDKATAGIQAISKRIDAITKPTRDLGKAIKELGEKSGLGDVVDGFKGAGGAVKDLLGKLVMVGGIAAAAAVGVLHLVGEFDDLGDLADRLGVHVDFLAQLRFAAERSGASVEQLDAGLQAFSQNLGAARAGTGRMTAFLKLVSPALLTQLKATKSNEEAFLLLADAMAKLKDPAKRAALAQKTVGDAALAPLLSQGAKGVAELMQRYFELAGSQENAAQGAGKVDDAMKDLKAATDGIKAAIVEGLSPALQVIVEQLQQWFVAHREDIRKWAAEIGKKLPGAIDDVVKAIKSALDTIVPFVEAIGGIRTIAVALAAVIVGPLVASIYSLGVALLTTPVGWIVAGIAAIAAGAFLLIKHWDGISAFFVGLWEVVRDAFGAFLGWVKDAFLTFTPLGVIIDHWEPIGAFFVGLWDGITSVFSKAWGIIKSIVDKIVGAVDTVTGTARTVLEFFNPSGVGVGGLARTISQDTLNAAVGAGAPQTTEARVKIELANAPRGTRVTTDPQSTADVDLSVGYQMIGLGA